MLFDPITWRANLPARKFISFDAFEHENMPYDVVVSDVVRAFSNASATRSSASSQVAARKCVYGLAGSIAILCFETPSLRISGSVSRSVW